MGPLVLGQRQYRTGAVSYTHLDVYKRQDMVREHIDRNTLFDYALSGDGSVRLQKEIDEDGEESYELCYWLSLIHIF